MCVSVCVSACVQEGQSVGGVDNVLVTAASRGIIQRQHQRGALFYKNYSLGNPFDNVTKDDLDAYRREVERKEKRRAGESEMDVLSNICLKFCMLCWYNVVLDVIWQLVSFHLSFMFVCQLITVFNNVTLFQ